jgi:hypothetical protein
LDTTKLGRKRGKIHTHKKEIKVVEPRSVQMQTEASHHGVRTKWTKWGWEVLEIQHVTGYIFSVG